MKRVQKPPVRRSGETSGEATGSPETSFCPLVEQVPYLEPRTKKIRFCSPSKKGSCPRAYTCQFSTLLKKNICCGRNNGAIGLIGLPGGGSVGGETSENVLTRIDQVSKIVGGGGSGGGGGSSASGSSTGPMTRAIQSTSDVCEKGEPYLVNGVPQTCTSTVCPQLYRCVFSKRSKNYFCCSKENVGTSTLAYKTAAASRARFSLF